jgi:site-specific DNA-methyltransferase (adenine-specific)
MIIGSGTTAIACINSGRSFIGFETDLDFFKAARDRIKSQTVPTDNSPFTFGLGSL